MAVGRFQVMATLQAARAYVLGLPVASAKSFGLNRAIFYAAAKRGFKGKGGVKTPTQFKSKAKEYTDREIKKMQKSFSMTSIGDEAAYNVEIDGKKFFVMGSEVQSPDDFAKQLRQEFQQGMERSREDLQRIRQGRATVPALFLRNNIQTPP